MSGELIVSSTALSASQIESTQGISHSDVQVEKNLNPATNINNHLSKNSPSLTSNVSQNKRTVNTVTAQMKPTGERVHPHLGEGFTAPINQIFNPKEISGTQNEQAILDGIKDILKDFKGDGKEAKIDFTKLGLSSKTIKKNQIEGKVWIDDNGKFQVKVNGYLGDDLRSAFIALKDNVGIAAKKSGLQNPITLDPNVLGKPSEPDRQVMERGGQIQYRALEGNKTLKLVLDPGKDGQDDGLTVSVLADYRGNEIKSIKTSAKIPLLVVFEGQELDGKRTDHPLLADWRTNRYFERAEIKSQWFFSAKNSDNINDVGRMQAQNDLWNAVNEYLKWSVAEDKAMGFIDTSVGNDTVKKGREPVKAETNKDIKDAKDSNKKLLEEAKKMSDSIKNIVDEAKEILADGSDNIINENLMKELDALVQNPEDLNNLDKLIQDFDELSQNSKNIKAEVHVKTKPAKSNFRQELIDKAKKLSNTLSKLTQQVKNDLNNSNVDRLGIPEGNTEHLRQYHEGEIEKNNNS